MLTGLPFLSPSSNYSTSTTPVTGVTPASETSKQRKTEKTESKGECQTCKSRKYVDGSNDAHVSFKTPKHIDPDTAASTVMAHEQEHVTHAKSKEGDPDVKSVNSSVSLKTAICPECGRSYISGGLTRTTITYGETKYDENKKEYDKDALLGVNVDEKI